MNITEISKGIPHIEDLPIGTFIDVLSNLSEYTITEKVDGAQILFGIDENGFYTSRESKGGQRIYAVEDYEINFPSTYKRSAHLLLEQALPLLRAAGMKRGDQVEAEVLYGELPNVVPYSADRNYLIFLRTTEGTVNIDRLKQKLHGQSLSISLPVPNTDDGKTIFLRENSDVWEFSRVPVISMPVIDLREHSSRLYNFLGTRDSVTSQSYKTILETPLNKIPVWCAAADWKDTKLYIKEKRDYIQELLIDAHILPIKELLLNKLVRGTKSEYGPLLEDGGWIEGVVLTSPTGKMVKLVDKDVFGTIRESAWEKRNYLTEYAKGVDSNAGFMGRLLLEMATALGHPELGTIQAKRYLRQVDILNEDVSGNIDFMSVKSYWSSLFEIKERELNRELDKYLRESSNNSLLDRAVKKRTLETFANSFERIEKFRMLTEHSNTVSDLISVLVGRYLGNLT